MKQPFTGLRERWTREKFERQTREHLPALYRTARRLSSQAADAEDLVHDTYIRAYQAFPKAQFKHDGELRAWLFRIMINLYRDKYRRRLRSPEVDAHAVDGETNIIELTASPDPDPEARAEQRRFIETAQAAIETLPPEMRVVVNLFYLEELSYKEIAAIVDCPVGTVMSRLSRGRKHLRRQLRGYWDDPAEIGQNVAG